MKSFEYVGDVKGYSVDRIINILLYVVNSVSAHRYVSTTSKYISDTSTFHP